MLVFANEAKFVTLCCDIVWCCGRPPAGEIPFLSPGTRMCNVLYIEAIWREVIVLSLHSPCCDSRSEMFGPLLLQEPINEGRLVAIYDLVCRKGGLNGSGGLDRWDVWLLVTIDFNVARAVDHWFAWSYSISDCLDELGSYYSLARAPYDIQDISMTLQMAITWYVQKGYYLQSLVSQINDEMIS